MSKLSLGVTALFAYLMFALAPAMAVPLTFERITDNAPLDSSAQIVVTVTDGGDGAMISFSLIDGVSPDASIAEIYFDDRNGLFVAPPVFVSSVGTVDFDFGSANPGELPGAGNASPAFVTTAGLLADADNPAPTNGVGVGEELVIKLLYTGGTTFEDVLAAIASGAFRVGLHIISLNAGQSDGFVSTGEVPIPGAIWLMGAGLAGLGFASRKKKSAISTY